jgi:short-subunit dehydrogenase
MQISGARVLLTGATGGLGHAIARALAERGGQLVLTGRRAEVLDPLATELGARALPVDLAQPGEVERLLEEAGEVDVLVANAALPASGTLDAYTVAQIDRALAVNVRAPIVLSHGLVGSMVARGGGHLVFMSSLSGKVASAGAALYNASKYALRGFASALRADLHGTGVGVSAVFPGFIRDAGMFADARVKLPPGVGTRSPEEVAAGVIDAIEHNRGEVDVAPLPLRASAMLGSVAPELAAGLARRLGAEEIGRRIGTAQRDKR